VLLHSIHGSVILHRVRVRGGEGEGEEEKKIKNLLAGQHASIFASVLSDASVFCVFG
jgi:hypothetical protein